MDMKPLMAELYGKATGCSKGKGGSMHFFDPSRNFWGGHGIVGGQIPLGTGIAYALKYRGVKGACLAFMGDGAVNQGAVHEAYNLAALWQLPVIFVIENNGYSMGTSQARSSAGDLARRAEPYGMDWGMCDGHDLYEVRAGIVKYLERAREESKPSVVEVRTYRYRGHSVADPDNTYRTKVEIEEYRKTKDPIQVFQALLLAEGVLDEGRLAEIDSAARAEAEQSAEFAEASPYPAVEDIQKDVYWEEDNPGEKKSQGRIFFD
jgi:pyruvate dehydrogenase E1 component alpha subunit